MSAGRPHSFADLVSQTPQAIPEVAFQFRHPKVVDGEVFVQFSKEELEKSAKPFRFAIVMKFLHQRPSLDRIRSFIHGRWGLMAQQVVSTMRRPSHVFVRSSNEEDFLKAMTRGSCDNDGVMYKLFQWSLDYSGDVEPDMTPVWIMLLGLPPNFYHEAMLRIVTAPIGIYLRRDNATRCATCTDGARVCVLMNIAQKPIQSFWIGTPKKPTSICQEVIYETLPAFYVGCKVQGHN